MILAFKFHLHVGEGGGGGRKRVCKWVSVLVFIYTWKRIMSRNKWAWAFHKVLYDLV